MFSYLFIYKYICKHIIYVNVNVYCFVFIFLFFSKKIEKLFINLYKL
jgi:hypothetical protein